MSQPASALQDIRSRLRGLRTRLRVIISIIGGARLLIALIGTLTVFFLSDYLLDLPMGVRRFMRLGLFDQPAGMGFPIWILLLATSLFLALALTRSRRGWSWLFAFMSGGIAGLAVWFGIRFFQGLRVPLSDADLALTVEKRYTALNDQLAASLDFDQELRAPSRGESPAMMQAVVDEAATHVARLSLAKAVSGRAAARWAGAAILACVTAVGVASAMPETLGLWFDRAMKLENRAWPKDTLLVAVVLDENGGVTAWDASRPYEVAHGRPLVIYAQAQGKVPSEVVLLDLVEGQSPEPRRMYRVPELAGVFAYEFRDVRSPFAFVLQGGDDEDQIPRYEVEITVPPRVINIRTVVTYPEYLGGKTQAFESGNPSVPQGSTVEVRFTTDVPVAQARVLRGEATQDLTAITLDGKDEFRFAFQAEKTLTYRLHLQTIEGRSNDSALDSYTVKVRRDRAPKTDWVYPRGTIEITPNGRVPLIARVTDDYGITKMELEVRTSAEHVTHYALRPFADAADASPSDPAGAPPVLFSNDGPYDRKQVLAYAALEVSDLTTADGKPLQPGAQWSVRIVAFDALGQKREGEWGYVDVFSGPELERGLGGQRSGVRSAFEALRTEQRSRHAELSAELNRTQDQDRADTIKAVRFAQNKIAQDADQAVRGLITVFNAFVYDRLGAKSPTGKILSRLDAHHRATYGLPPASGAGGTPRVSSANWIGDPVFPYPLYDRIVNAWKQKTIFDRGLLDRMLAVMEDAVDVASRVAPEAHNALSRALSGDEDALKQAVAAQQACLDALERLLTKMESWRSLNDMTVEVRGLIEDQRALEAEIGRERDAEKSGR